MLTRSVSVIIPAFNCAAWLGKTLDSCLLQGEYIKEIIVVDDYSTDNSREVLEEYQGRFPGLIRVYSNEKKGGNNARNFGFSQSTGQYIQWLDADDQLEDGKLEAQLRHFSSDPSIDIVYSDWKLITYEGDTVVRTELKQNRQYKDYLFELLTNNWSAPHSYLLKRSVAERLHEIKAWNPATAVYQDREYFTMAALEGARFAYTPGYFAVYNRWNRVSVSAAKTEVRYEYFEKILSRFEDLLHQEGGPFAGRTAVYQHILTTQKLLIRGAGFPATIRYRESGLPNLSWRMVKGVRTTVRFIREYFKWKFSE